MKIPCIAVTYRIVHFIPALANASYQLCCCEKDVVKRFTTDSGSCSLSIWQNSALFLIQVIQKL